MRLNRALPNVFAVSVCALIMTACGGGGGSGRNMGQQTVTTFTDHALVSDGAFPADHVDSNLQNPWGIVFNPTGPVWIADNNTNVSTLYDGTGAMTPLIVSIPAGSNGPSNPTGIIYNGTSDFVVGSGATAAPGQFIYSGEGGTIAAWAPTVSLNMATTVHDDGAGGAVYKGLALANNGSGNFLYATDIHNAKIDVFDTHFNKVAMAGGFSDPNIPAGYAPFGIAAIQNQLYVTYAKQDAAKHDEVFGVGFGYVDIFDANGNLIKRFASQGLLNAPWGIAVAPANFGILIGNFGDGLLNIFNPTSGQFIGTATQANGQPLVIPGLWGLVYGNGQSNQPSNALFYTAGPNNQMDGIFGRIDAVTTTTTTPGSGGMPCTGYGC